MRKASFLLAMFTIQTIMFVSCKNKNNPDSGIRGIIQTGLPVEVAKEEISTDGGQIIIDKKNDPLDGFKINVPKGSFADSRKFKIFSAPITSHTFGPDFNPITPMITISNGGGYADSLITIEIPVHVPQGQFAMAFLYNEKTGKLEGMPLLSSGPEKIVVATNNFEHSSAPTGNALAMQAASSGEIPVDKMVVTAIEEKKLDNPFSSGFKPGIDDIPAMNHGSSFATHGVCDGQTQAMMWYYNNKRQNGAPGLFSLLDDDGGRPTPQFSNDDTKAIKFASMMQHDFLSLGLPFHFVASGADLFGQSLLGDRSTYFAFAYSFLLTHEPQYVAIYGRDGILPMGHAMIVYKMDSSCLYIADPNWPGKTDRRIEFQPFFGKFKPYNGRENADLTDFQFPLIFYFGKFDLMQYPNAEKYWKEVEDGTIGNGSFPEFSILALNDQVEYVPLTDGFQVPGDKGILTISVRAPGFVNKFEVFNAVGNPLLVKDGAVSLPKGEQIIGIKITDEKGKWAGFKWINVKVNEKKEETTAPPPDMADLNIDVNINGNPHTIKRSNFYIENNKIRFRIPLNVEPTSPIRMDIQADWKGEGKYDNVQGYVELLTYEPKGQCFIKNGTMVILKWADGKLYGSFKLDCGCGYEPNVVPYLIKGQFNYSSEVGY